MRNTIREFIEPTNKEKHALWEKGVFVFDTNILLNLYRYSAKTRNSLLAAFESFKNRVWIPYQIAYEYMNRRCDVIYETVQRYEQFKKDIDLFTTKAIDTLRLTNNDEEISELKRYLFRWLDENKDRNLLVLNTDEDEILSKILEIFEGKVGQKMDMEELELIKKEGKIRFEKAIPPGYKDGKKAKSEEEDNNAYGDLIIWKQIIKYARENKVGIIFITHDQKPDWWNIVKGKTIGPRVELRKEFEEDTNQEFHMYSMNSFINTYNRLNEIPIEKSVVEEVIGLDESNQRKQRLKRTNLSLSEKIARLEDTIEKLQNRIQRRNKVVIDIENKYQKEGINLPENIQYQYNNTISKIQELQEMHDAKVRELEILKQTISF